MNHVWDDTKSWTEGNGIWIPAKCGTPVCVQPNSKLRWMKVTCKRCLKKRGKK